MRELHMCTERMCITSVKHWQTRLVLHPFYKQSNFPSQHGLFWFESTSVEGEKFKGTKVTTLTGTPIPVLVSILSNMVQEANFFCHIFLVIWYHLVNSATKRNLIENKFLSNQNRSKSKFACGLEVISQHRRPCVDIEAQHFSENNSIEFLQMQKS